jgi:rhodanese-related sulfurtransferase
MAAATRCARPHRKLKDGDELSIGNLRFRALEVPGHTPDSIALHWQGASEGLVLTGDTLFAGGLARSDFRGSDPARLFDSVQRKLTTLPDATVVLPGHGYQDVLFTTIGHERAHNAALKHADGRAYAASLRTTEGAGNTPDVDLTLETNQAAEPKLPEQPGAVAACCSMGAAAIAGPKIREMKCEELAPSLAELTRQQSWIDVRDPWELAKDGRIPGARSYPLSELGFHLAELRRDAPTILSCRSGVRSMTAAKTLAYLGVLKEPISMSGGFGRWKELGLPTY